MCRPSHCEPITNPVQNEALYVLDYVKAAVLYVREHLAE